MVEVLARVPLDRETKAGLLGQPSVLGPVYQLMLAHESGDWATAAQLGTNLWLDSEEVGGYYLPAQQWAREVSAGE